MNLSYCRLFSMPKCSFYRSRKYAQKSVETFNNSIRVPGKQSQNPLELSCDDVSNIRPYFPESFNIAGYVNKSETLQKLLLLNVNLSKIEKKPYAVNKILKLDFDRDMKNHIYFLKDYVGLDNTGNFLTKNPLILCEPVEDLQVRINYLKSKRFTMNEIQRIIINNPFWLMFSSVRIDRRLGYFQQKFNLCGNEVRQLSTRQPKIITYNLHHINTNTFVIKEEMGFNDVEAKHLILFKPNLWLISQRSLLQRFNYFHNTMKISHQTLLNNPHVLLCRNFKVKQRHLFLKSLERAQYDPRQENYIPINALVEDTDSEFCRKYAKCNVDDFNTFLKTL